MNGFLGGKYLNEDDWEPVESQGASGVEVDFRPRSWPINLVVGVRGSATEEEDFFDPFFFGEVDVEGQTSEITVGVKKIWEPAGTARPFLGGGLAIIRAEFSVKPVGIEVSDSDSAVGIWVGGGVYWTLGEHFNIGVDARASWAEVTLFDVDADAGGSHLGLLLGYHW